MHFTNEPSEGTYVGSGPRANAVKRVAQARFPEHKLHRERGYIRRDYDNGYLAMSLDEWKRCSFGGNMARR